MRCDVSFDGEFMVYLAMGASGKTWNGVCRLPWLTTVIDADARHRIIAIWRSHLREAPSIEAPARTSAARRWKARRPTLEQTSESDFAAIQFYLKTSTK
jgi:hypothetical protein